MAENSITTITIGENIKVEDEKKAKNGDVHVPESETTHLENGDIKKVPEEPPKVEEVSKEESINVAENEEKIPTDAVGKIIDEAIKEEIELAEVADKENGSKIIEEDEEGSNEITRSFEVVQVNEKHIESKNDEIITLQEVTILPLKEDQTKPSKKLLQKSQLVVWDTRKTIFFYLFLFAFVAWIIAYYAFDTGLIPNDKK